MIKNCTSNSAQTWVTALYDVGQGCTTFCYCQPHYFHLHEVWPPTSTTHAHSALIWLAVTAKCQLTQNTFKHKLCIHSITLRDITFQIVTLRVDWFSCLAFVLLQYMPARPPNPIFQITYGWLQISLSKAAAAICRLCTIDIGTRLTHTERKAA